MSSRCGHDSSFSLSPQGRSSPGQPGLATQRELPPGQETVASEQRAFPPDMLSAATCSGPQKRGQICPKSKTCEIFRPRPWGTRVLPERPTQTSGPFTLQLRR